jgi:hypothetical protein
MSRFGEFMRSTRQALQTLIAASAAVVFVAGPTFAQQPQSSTSTFAVNAKYVQGFAPGYWPTQGSGLTLNLAPGTVVCDNRTQNYAGGQLSLAPSATNYIFLNISTNCVPASNTTGFTDAAIPIATVTTNATGIISVTDARTWFTGARMVNNVAFANRYSGADDAAKMNNCLVAAAALSSNGGVCDARALTGLRSGTRLAVPPHTQLLLGGVTLSLSGNPAVTLGDGASIIGLGSAWGNEGSKINVTTSGATGLCAMGSTPDTCWTFFKIAANGAVRASNVVTITTATAHNFQVGNSVVLRGVSYAGATSFNGTFTIVSVPSPTTFTFNQTGENGTGSGGTASNPTTSDAVIQGVAINGTSNTGIGVQLAGVSRTRIEDNLLAGFATQLQCYDGTAPGDPFVVDNTYIKFINNYFSSTSSQKNIELRGICNAFEFFANRFTGGNPSVTIGNTADTGSNGTVDEVDFIANSQEGYTVAYQINRAIGIRHYGGRGESSGTFLSVNSSCNAIYGIRFEVPYLYGSTAIVSNSCPGVDIVDVPAGTNYADGLNTSPGPNLLPNALMEGWSGTTTLYGWGNLNSTSSTWPTGSGAITKNTGVVKVAGTAGAANAQLGDMTSAYSGMFTTSRIPVDSSLPYSFSGQFASATANAPFRLAFKLYDANNNLITSQNILQLNYNILQTGSLSYNPAGFTGCNCNVQNIDAVTSATPNTFSRYTYAWRFPSATKSVQFAIIVNSSTSTLYADELYFSPGEALQTTWSQPRHLGDSDNGGTVTVNSNLALAGGAHFNQGSANSDFSGTLTLASGTASRTFSNAFASAPVCVAADTTAANPVKVSTTNTALTVTGTGSDIINYVCFGNPN